MNWLKLEELTYSSAKTLPRDVSRLANQQCLLCIADLLCKWRHISFNLYLYIVTWCARYFQLSFVRLVMCLLRGVYIRRWAGDNCLQFKSRAKTHFTPNYLLRVLLENQTVIHRRRPTSEFLITLLHNPPQAKFWLRAWMCFANRVARIFQHVSESIKLCPSINKEECRPWSGFEK